MIQKTEQELGPYIEWRKLMVSSVASQSRSVSYIKKIGNFLNIFLNGLYVLLVFYG